MEIGSTPPARSAAATAAPDEAGVAHTVRRYLDDPLTEAELTDVLDRLGLELWHITRTGSRSPPTSARGPAGGPGAPGPLAGAAGRPPGPRAAADPDRRRRHHGRRMRPRCGGPGADAAR